MPYLTQREKEAFYRGKAAGITPADYPMPKTGEEKANKGLATFGG